MAFHRVQPTQFRDEGTVPMPMCARRDSDSHAPSGTPTPEAGAAAITPRAHFVLVNVYDNEGRP